MSKLKDDENYCFWSIYIQTTLESKIYWNIIISIWKTLIMPKNNTSNDNKKEYLEYIQSHTIAKSILVLSIDLSILMNDYATNSAK